MRRTDRFQRIRKQRQQGMALIMAVLMVALAAILTAGLTSDGYLDQRRTSTMLSIDQAYELGLGAEAFAAEALLEDAKNSQIDTPAEAWNTPVTLPVDEGIGVVKGNLEDLQGRFNLNSLLNQDGSTNEEAVRQFQHLLELVGLETKWARMLVDWIDAGTEPQPLDGAEDSVYTAQSPSYLTANMPITRTSELMSLVGFTIDNYNKLEKFVSALPIGTPINVCTASGVVLDSLSTNSVEYSRDDTALQKGRESGCFPSLKILDSTLSEDVEYKKLKTKNILSETTSYFRANILITLGTTEFTLYSTLHRGSDGRTHVIQRSFGTM